MLHNFGLTHRVPPSYPLEFITTLGLDWPSSCCRELTGSWQNLQRLFPPMKSVMSFQSFWKSILYTEKEMEQKFLIRKRKGGRCQQHTKYKFPISQSTQLSFPRHPQQKNKFVVMTENVETAMILTRFTISMHSGKLFASENYCSKSICMLFLVIPCAYRVTLPAVLEIHLHSKNYGMCFTVW